MSTGVSGDQPAAVRLVRVLYIVDDLRDGDRLISRVPQGGHLLPELVKAYNGPIGALLGKVVVHQHRQAAASAAPGNIPDVRQQQDHHRQQRQKGS